MSVEQIDLLSREFIDDPYPYLEELRAKPVAWNDKLKGWVISGHDEVLEALQRTASMSSDRVGNYVRYRASGSGVPDGSSSREILSRWLAFNDPPSHTRLRRLVAAALTPRAVSGLAGRVEEICLDLVDGLRERDVPEFDVISDYSYPLPVTIISELLGIPAADHARIRDWSAAAMLVVFMALETDSRHEQAEIALSELAEYLRFIVDQRREQPEDDLISALVRAEAEHDALTTEEIIATITLLLFGGHETTSNLIANGMLALLQNPAELRRLRADPDLMPTAIEEFLRYDGPIRGFLRWVRQDAVIGNVTLRPGERAFVVVDGANRDPKVFDAPDVLDISRTPNRHVEFGYGIHHCLGAPLARIEAPIAFRTLLDGFPRLALKDERPEWSRALLSRNMRRLQVQVG
jgi:cytochrome P450